MLSSALCFAVKDTHNSSSTITLKTEKIIACPPWTPFNLTPYLMYRLKMLELNQMKPEEKSRNLPIIHFKWREVLSNDGSKYLPEISL